LANRDAPELVFINGITGDGVRAFVETIRGGVDGIDEIGTIGPSDQHRLQTSLDHLRPQTSIVTYRQANGIQGRVIWNDALSTSAFTEVVRYVTGRSDVTWPSSDNYHWIEGAVEHQARRIHADTQHHYTAFHNIASCSSYTEEISHVEVDDHIGNYTAYQTALFPILNDSTGTRTANMAIADYAEPLIITTQTEDGQSLINGIYPVDYQNLPGIAPINYKNTYFWSSLEREFGEDFMEIDLGTTQAVNYVTFETIRKPFNITVGFDVLDMGKSTKRFVDAVIDPTNSNPSVSYAAGFTNPWEAITLKISDSLKDVIFTRFIRLRFTRRFDFNSPYVDGNGDVHRMSVEIRNLRVGRIAAP
jgi:hypothetical protein